MGVPGFYRWLVGKYPEIVCDADRKKTNPNQNGSELEIDNLYLDMNCLFHNSPTNIYKYIDKIVDIVRPLKLLYLAIDGVAPGAKRNQQRSGYFKSAKNEEHYEEVEKKFTKEFEMCGKKVLPTEVADSIVVLPGTEFMHLLSKKLQCYIKRRMSDDPLWKTIKVILSDSNVPGEGEHKIMSFIRAQRCCQGYNPNTRHCLYGLDADLIMLALASHEVHFSILREFVGQQPPMPESYHPEATSGSERSYKGNELKTPAKNTRFQFLKVWLLREYLEIDMHISDLPANVKMDLERIIDDFVFLCFFAGNDFLPHMPTLEIHEGAIDLLIHVYKNEFKKLGGYLVDVQKIEDKKNGYIRLKRVEKFILSVGEFEEEIFKKRTEIFEKKMRRILSQQSNDVEDEDHECGSWNLPSSSVGADAFHSGKGSVTASVSSNSGETGSCTDMSELLKNTEELKQKVKDYIRSQSDTLRSGAVSDKVKLASSGFKGRYYRLKFSTKSPDEMERKRKELVQKYTEGLLWVLTYYYSGVASWNWFYPYHYGPFASDLKGLAQVKVVFQKGLPLKPYDQLLAVLPPKSAHALPDPYHKLMVDEDSGIADFYPTDFQMDADGKRFMWQAVCKLPFIEEYRLLKETEKVEEELKAHEKIRNTETPDRLFVGASSSLVEQISELYKSHHHSLSENGSIKINSQLSDGINGVMHFCEENEEVPSVLCLFYMLPEGCNYKHHLLEGVTIPEKTITEADVVEKQLWHEFNGYAMHRAPMKQDVHGRAGWRGSGRGNLEDLTLLARQSTALRPYTPTLGSNFYSSNIHPTSAGNLNMGLEKQCTLSGSHHDQNRWRSNGQGPLQNGFSSNPRFCKMVREPDNFHRDAGVGWGRGRGRGRGRGSGRFDNSSLQTGRGTAFKSYPQPPRINFPANTYSTSANRLNLSAQEQYNLSEGFSQEYGARTATSAGSRQNNAPTGTSSAGSWQNSSPTGTISAGSGQNSAPTGISSAGSWQNSPLTGTSSAGSRPNYNANHASIAWMPIHQTSPALEGQHGYGRGQYVQKTTPSSWNSQSRHGNSSYQ